MVTPRSEVPPSQKCSAYAKLGAEVGCFTLLTGIYNQIESKLLSCSVTSSSSNGGSALQTACPKSSIALTSYASPLHCLMEEKILYDAVNLKTVVSCTNQMTAPLSENNI